MCADGGLTMPAACAHRPSGRRLAAQGKAASLTDQGVSALAAESVYVPRFFSLDFFTGDEYFGLFESAVLSL